MLMLFMRLCIEIVNYIKKYNLSEIAIVEPTIRYDEMLGGVRPHKRTTNCDLRIDLMIDLTSEIILRYKRFDAVSELYSGEYTRDYVMVVPMLPWRAEEWT